MAGHGNGDQFRPLLDDYLNAAHRDEAALVSWARKVTSPCDNDDPEESLWQLWRASLDCARAQSDCNGQPRRERIASLIQLTAAIKAIHPPPLNSKGEISECWAGKLFVDMPILGATMREALDEQSRLSPQEWHNQIIFSAILTQEKVVNLSLHALWLLRGALEGDSVTSQAEVMDGAIIAAGEWILTAGETLVRLDDDYGRKGAGGPKWQGKEGWSKERWKLWQGAFLQYSGDSALEDSTREIARQASAVIGSLL